MTFADPDHRFRLLAIHAHPDDESSKGGATMARYAAEGHRVRVVTCTGGEEGSILNPVMDRDEVRNNIVAVRHQEMSRAAQILGVEHNWLGYVDSGLPESRLAEDLPAGCFARQDVEKVAADLVREIRTFRPHVIITYDENGGYPHPDHLMVHAASMLAWQYAGDPAYTGAAPAGADASSDTPAAAASTGSGATAASAGENAPPAAQPLGEPWAPLKLYYTHGFVVTRFNRLADEIARKRDAKVIDQQEFERTEGLLAFWRGKQDVFPRVTTQVQAGDWFETRDDALRAHATQIDPNGPFFSVNVELQRNVWPTEEFELARARVASELPEDDLFAGLGNVRAADDLAETNPAEVSVNR